METQNIELDGVEFVPIDSVELDEKAENVGERLSRTLAEFEGRKTNRQSVLDERELTAHINKHYGRELKDVGAFIQLCKIKGLKTADTAEILTLFKSLPKAAKKSTLSRFLKL